MPRGLSETPPPQFSHGHLRYIHARQRTAKVLETVGVVCFHATVISHTITTSFCTLECCYVIPVGARDDGSVKLGQLEASRQQHHCRQRNHLRSSAVATRAPSGQSLESGHVRATSNPLSSTRQSATGVSHLVSESEARVHGWIGEHEVHTSQFHSAIHVVEIQGNEPKRLACKLRAYDLRQVPAGRAC